MRGLGRTLALAFVLAGCAADHPRIGPWSQEVPEASHKPEARAEFLAYRSEFCLPKVSELAVPVFPEVEVFHVEWSRKVPDCHSISSPGAIKIELILLTRRPLDEVLRWHDSRLPGFAKYAARQTFKGEVVDFSVYREGERIDFSWDRDWKRLNEVRHVVVSPVSKHLEDQGYGAWIEITDPGPAQRGK